MNLFNILGGIGDNLRHNLERGRWSASIDKIEQMAEMLGVHPVSVILAGYLASEEEAKSGELLERIRNELREIGL
ncbi:hypothetical protein J2Y88_004305 [Pseudomonas chlororaphis]|uniref:hypothetical protein n=1 Tax=Pseudomonas chlororaphis TaxID=587753 RepID=UPI0020A1B9B5|nr:hypothetical protein [Pseudomonas chlororaphis]MCP1481994.1 hypothetical protein [Pseudomonas chlororaphis]MCP1597647.1 hypothetical protein [Pseudomonas chlororaphis]